MPIANKYSIDEILDACRNYFAKTGRRITFEYSLVLEKMTAKRMQKSFRRVFRISTAM